MNWLREILIGLLEWLDELDTGELFMVGFICGVVALQTFYFLIYLGTQ